MQRSLDLDPAHVHIVRNILASHLPQNHRIWFFGSRATGHAKPFSDIDILIDIGEPMSLQLLAKLIAAFDESILPYKVDVADFHAISDEFKQNIQSQLIPLFI